MLSGGRTQFVALKAKMPWLDINQERHHAYAGYEGMVDLVREIDKALYNPVWEQVRLPAPWDEVSWEERADLANAEEAAALAANPEAAREAERKKIVCECNSVDAGTLEDIIRAEHLTDVASVTAHTQAAGGCGSCGDRVAAMLERINHMELPGGCLHPCEWSHSAPARDGSGMMRTKGVTGPAPSSRTGASSSGETGTARVFRAANGDILCYCNDLYAAEVEKTIKAEGLTRLDQVTAITHKDDPCALCSKRIEALLAHVQEAGSGAQAISAAPKRGCEVQDGNRSGLRWLRSKPRKRPARSIR